MINFPVPAALGPGSPRRCRAQVEVKVLADPGRVGDSRLATAVMDIEAHEAGPQIRTVFPTNDVVRSRSIQSSPQSRR
jgi:hypothetical protein